MNKLYYIYDEVPSSALYYISGFLIIGVLCYLILSKAIIPMFRERKDYTMLDKIKCLVICLMLVLIVLYLSYCLCSDLILKYRFENGKYDTVVGEIVVNSIEEKNYRYKSGEWYSCSFTVDGVEFPGDIDYTQQQCDMFTSAERAIVSYTVLHGDLFVYRIYVLSDICHEG